MTHSKQTNNGYNRRDFLKVAGMAGAGLFLAGCEPQAQKQTASTSAPKPAPTPAPTPQQPTGGNDGFYQFVNKTNGKWKDSEIFWSRDMTQTWHSIDKEPTAPTGGNGRLYFSVGPHPQNLDDWNSYWDFIEYNSNGRKWAGNTTQVDAWCLPLTIEMGKFKFGITGPRTKMFEEFKKECPKEFKNCILNDNKWITSPFRADMGPGKPYENYFEKYVDDIWKKYAQETKTPSGKFIGKADANGALVFRPAEGVSFAGDPKWLTCPSKPTTKNILLGEGVLGGNPAFCAAFNRGIADDPADWRDESKFYQKEPCNWYSKFLHKWSVNHKAYGFCYDDYAEQAAYFAAEADHLVVTFYWD
jgi:hypothetical protein